MSEQIQLEQPERYQYPHRALGTASFQEVAAIFEDFVPRLPRGGHPRPHKKPFFNQGSAQCPVPPDRLTGDYHVESSFTEAHRPYLTTAMVYLKGLVEGKVFGERESLPLPLSARTYMYFQYSTTRRSFNRAISEGMIDTLTEFATRYPNLMPAMMAAFGNAGALGVQTAVDRAQYMLQQAIQGQQIQSTIPPHAFINPSGVVYDQGQVRVNYEVHCAGMNVAEAMLQQSALAAVSLSRIPRVRDNYKPYIEEATASPNESIYKNHLDMLYMEVLTDQLG